MSAAKIRALENGPLLVSGVERLSGSDGPIQAGAEFALCRCGASANKPFCDGAHGGAGFTGAKDPSRTEDRTDEYVGEALTVRDNRGLCAHAGVCTEILPEVWRMHEEPWIDPDGAPPEAVAAVVRACPSGALSSNFPGDDAGEEEGPSVLVVPNGPYVVKGLSEVDGEPVSATCTLCRCGASKNKPRCDGSHWGVEFEG
ncbi:MAG: CDGSH iron-sulfur domain-containing protein [Planctomycetota bacterium]|nr:CDGSH iron-sulfur domain-containing protein [Planctomycetota bacterium]